MRWRGLSHESTPESHLPLALQLQRIRENSERYVTPETTAVHERAIAHLRATNVPAGALAPGARMPAFSLQDQHGALVASTSLLAHGRLIVTFFRGRWCPYCVTTLESLQFIYPEIQSRGASLVAISPQKVQHNFLTSDQHHLRFPLLSDPENALARAFGIAYTIPAEQAALYRSVFVNLDHLNDHAPDSLPLPATFTVGPAGVIEHAYADPDFRIRPEPASLLALL